VIDRNLERGARMKRLFQTGEMRVRVNEYGIEIAVCPVAGQLIMVLIAIDQNVAQTANHNGLRARSAGVLQQRNEFRGKLFSAERKKFDEQDFRLHRA